METKTTTTDLVLDEGRDPHDVLLRDGLALEGLKPPLELVHIGHHLLGTVPLVVLVFLLYVRGVSVGWTYKCVYVCVMRLPLLRARRG